MTTTNDPTPTPATRTSPESLCRGPIARYTHRALAFQAAARTRAGAVMLGDDGKFWVVTMADAARLEAAGYEWAD